QALLYLLLIPPVAGAVLLTRFGTMPYATRGVSGVSTSAQAVRQSAPLPGEMKETRDEQAVTPVVAEEQVESPGQERTSTHVIDLEQDHTPEES
ncbi:MAG: hypothetical protein P1S60_17305, partial [Anaerolineae bacterium]|nr:hypothetical protein [Anaerolineae bacterium]